MTQEEINKLKELAKQGKIIEESVKHFFPEVFKEDKYFDFKRLVTTGSFSNRLFTDDSAKEAGFASNGFLAIRIGGNFKYRAFYLDSNYNWTLERDDVNELCLVPTKKPDTLEL